MLQFMRFYAYNLSHADFALLRARGRGSLEREWVRRAEGRSWKEEVCSRERRDIELWYSQVSGNRLIVQAPDRSVFSMMHDDTDNSGAIEWIEPLAYYLRGPLYPCLTEQLLAKFCCPTVLDPDVAEATESARA